VSLNSAPESKNLSVVWTSKRSMPRSRMTDSTELESKLENA
jgi:hypothetical protein